MPSLLCRSSSQNSYSLFGVTIAQTLFYLWNYQQDSRLLKAFVRVRGSDDGSVNHPSQVAFLWFAIVVSVACVNLSFHSLLNMAATMLNVDVRYTVQCSKCRPYHFYAVSVVLFHQESRGHGRQRCGNQVIRRFSPSKNE